MASLPHFHHHFRFFKIPERKQEETPENTIFQGFLNGSGRKPERGIQGKNKERGIRKWAENSGFKGC